MKYTFTSAWLLRGGFTLAAGASERMLFSSEAESFVLTRSPNEALAPTDRTQAIGRALLRGLSGDPVEDVDAFVEAEVAEIVAQRNQVLGSGIVLLHVAHGDVDVELEGKSRREVGGQLVVLDAVDKREVARVHEPNLRAMQLSLALESRNTIRFRSLASGLQLTQDDLVTVHTITFYATGEAVVTSVLPAEAEASIGDRYAHLRSLPGLASVQRLFSQMSDDGNDRLKSFLAGWAALEIMISKTFTQLEDRFLEPFSQGGQVSLRERFLSRVQDVMKDKYRLADKFIAVAAVLLPEAQPEELDGDFREFCELKKLRDSIYHGDEFVEKDLPVERLTRLLTKYVGAYLSDTDSV